MSRGTNEKERKKVNDKVGDVGLDAKFLMEKRKSFGTDRNGENGKLLSSRR